MLGHLLWELLRQLCLWELLLLLWRLLCLWRMHKLPVRVPVLHSPLLIVISIPPS